MPTRITKLTPEQEAAMAPWADQWIAKGLSTEPADWEAFEEGARACYAYAGIPWPGRVVRVANPLVLSLAAPIATHLLMRTGTAVSGAVREAVDGAVDGAVRRAVDEAVDGAVDGAVRRAVDGAVSGAVSGAVRRAVDEAVGGAVDGAVRRAVDEAVGGAVDGAVDGAVRRAVDGAVSGAVSALWWRRIGGCWWLSWQAWTGFFRDVCQLELPGDLWERDRAYAQAQQSAGWWWPHRQFVMVCDRPTEIHLEQTRPRGWGSHRLHCETGPAISWRDDWAIHTIHGVRVPAKVVEAPETLTAAEITAESNVEVRRIMVERFGADRYVREAGAERIHSDDWGTLWRLDQNDDEPVCVVQVLNSTPEPDGHFREYMLRVPPDMARARQAVAWTFDVAEDDYMLAMQT